MLNTRKRRRRPSAASAMAEDNNWRLRPTSPALDDILGRRFSVLDDGFVRVVDYLGTDVSIVQAARVSYGAGTKAVSEDRSLIRYLMRHRHTTPFEMCEIKLHVRVPMDTWRQWVRHRTASINEYSTRYSVAIDRAQRTDVEDWRLQSNSNRQGSGGGIAPATGEMLTRRESEFQTLAREVYDERLKVGVAREQARKDLPLSTYTEAYWKIDLHNLFHFLSLRMDTHAQVEIRAYAQTIGSEIVARWTPIAWQAFLEYRVNAVSLSQTEAEMLRLHINGAFEAAREKAEALGWLKWDPTGTKMLRNRERDEFVEKMSDRFGITVDWLRGDRKGDDGRQ